MDWLAWVRRGRVRVGGAVFLLLRVAAVAGLLGGSECASAT